MNQHHNAHVSPCILCGLLIETTMSHMHTCLNYCRFLIHAQTPQFHHPHTLSCLAFGRHYYFECRSSKIHITHRSGPTRVMLVVRTHCPTICVSCCDPHVIVNDHMCCASLYYIDTPRYGHVWHVFAQHISRTSIYVVYIPM